MNPPAPSASAGNTSGAISKIPPPPASSAAAIAFISSMSANVPGTGSPSRALWAIVRLVEKPTAPASRASRTMRAISRRSSSVAFSLRAPRSPITYPRTAPCGTYAATSTEYFRRSIASRYSGKLSHSQVMPSCSAVPGISSTPSMSCTSQASLPFCTGAKPTPQFPTTTVVTPLLLDGSRTASQLTWPS